MLVAGATVAVSAALAVPVAGALPATPVLRAASLQAATIATATTANVGSPVTATTPVPLPTAAPVTVGPLAPPAGVLGGHDVSWPQCPPAVGGFGNPMPGDGAFLVIGLSNGQSFSTNPCLADEIAAAHALHQLVAAYVIPTYPTNADFARYGGSGPYGTASFASRLSNVGWQQAAYWVQVKRAAGLSTPMVWVDIEQKKQALPWPASPARQNLPVIRGLLAGLRHAGLRTGIYSPASHWQEITGGVRLGLPEWRTVGGGTAAQAYATCAKPGVQGSPILLAQYYSPTVDYDVLCPVARTGNRLRTYFTQY
jgi:hypothetical protein